MAVHYSVLQLFLIAGLLAGVSTEPLPRQTERFQEQEDTSNISIEALREEWDAIASAPLTSDVVKFSNGTELQLFPNTPELLHKHANSTRRVLGDFRQCSPCTCCDRSRRWCLPTVCCYNIRCGVRGLPFGLCSFIPVSCACFGCRS